MTMEPQDRRQIEQLLQWVHGAWRGRAGGRGLLGGQQAVLSNGLQVTIGLEPGIHNGQGAPDEPRLWLAVSRADRFPTFHEIQTLIGLVFTPSQQGSANPLAISTALHMPNAVLCSSRLSRGESRPA
jgi:hypothetical protein